MSSFVAEISANHNGNLNTAIELVTAAKECGANYVKFQTYKPETMTLPLSQFSVEDGHQLWSGRNLFDLYQDAMTPWEWHRELFEHARSIGIVPFSSPFDRSAVDFLEDLGCPIYKIASLETGDLDLIRYVANTKKPLIVSTGATSISEIEELITVAENAGNKELTLLVCTSSYPTTLENSHIARIKTLQKLFGKPVGLSDHTKGISTSIVAISLGATIIEKHITLDRALGGLDSEFSLEPNEFKLLINLCNEAEISLGNPEWRVIDTEDSSRKLRRSLYIVEDVRKGEIATRKNVKSLRPNLGGPIRDLDYILGKKFRDSFKAGNAATRDCVYEDSF